MAECEGLALVTLAKIEKWPSELREVSEGCDKVWARRYENLSGTLPCDNILEQQWHGSGSRDYPSLNMHNFLDTYLNGASKASICIYKKSKCWHDDWL